MSDETLLRRADWQTSATAGRKLIERRTSRHPPLDDAPSLAAQTKARQDIDLTV